MGTIGLGTNNSNGALTVAGGSLIATGTVTVGNQATAGRGGAMRVIGGTFTSTDTVNGIVLARTSGTNANNVASAAFTGGVSTVEKITLGFDATVTAGSATVTVNGGTLYLGAGGIVRNGAGTFASTLNFSAGTVGARSNWSTSLPIALPSGGNVVFKAADASDLPRDITLTGGLSGAGGLTKAGLGTLVLPAANTFTGPVGVNAGVLRVDGSLAPGDLVSVNGGGILAGTGTVNRAVLLGAGGIIRPGSASPGSTLTAATLTWNGGGALAIDLTSGNRLAVAGALNRGSGGALHVELAASAPPAVGTVVTLATFASTDAVPGDFTYSGLPDCRGVFIVGPTSLAFLVTGAGPTAAYTDWAYQAGLPADQQGAAQDPDNDGLVNLLEFVLARDPLQTNVSGIIATTVVVDGQRFPAVTFVRRLDLGGVTIGVLTSADLAFASLLGVEQVSVHRDRRRAGAGRHPLAGAARPAAESVLPARGDAAARAGGDHRHVVTGRRHEPAHGSRALRPRRAADFRGSLRRRGRFEHRDQPGVLRGRWQYRQPARGRRQVLRRGRHRSARRRALRRGHRRDHGVQ